MKADPAGQRRLLDLQAVDTALRQLAHRRATLPELGQLARCAERGNLLTTRTADISVRLTDLADAQRRLENDVDTVRTRATRDEARLAGGGLPGKELEGLQHEITSLARRQSTLEDELLDIMEQREGIDAEMAIAVRERAEIDADVARLTHARDQAFAEIDAQRGEYARTRQDMVADLPADLLALYEKVATANGGVGAAALHQRRCEGCRIELAGNELAAVRGAGPDDVLRCENCRRILVRTLESGL